MKFKKKVQMHNYGPRGSCIIVMKFEKDPFSTVPKIAVTIFHSQNPKWPSVGHLEFTSVQKSTMHNKG